MSQTYAEFLKSQGAGEEEIKLLDTPIGRKAYEKMLADADQARLDGEAAKAAAKKDREQLEGWFSTTAVPEFKEMERRAIAAEAESAKARAAWKAAQERGLVDLEQLKALGYDTGAPTTPAAPAAPALPAGFDPAKYITTDSLKGLSDGVGDGLAVLQDIVMEHAQLFPDKPLRVRELRKEAVAHGKTVEQYWSEKYNVIAAREKKAADDKAAWEAKLREEGAAKARTELAAQYGNPELRPGVPSTNAFTKRAETGRDKQPWQRADDASNDRVQRATQRIIERQNVTH